MTDKNAVDDYYSAVPHSSNTSDSNDSDKKKPKLKLRKASVIRVKKPVEEKPKIEEPIITEEKKEAPIELVKEKVVIKTPQPPVIKRKRIIQSMEVEKKREAPRPARPSTNKNTEKPVKKEEVKKEETKKPFKIKRGFKSVASGGNNNDFSKSKKSKLSPFAGKKTRGRVGLGYDDGSFSRSHKINKAKEEKKVEDIKQNLVDRSGETVVVGDVLSLKELSEKIGVVLPKLIAEFMKNGIMVNINSKIDFDTASIISEAFEVKLERDKSGGMNIEDVLAGDMTTLLKEDDSSKLKTRPPVISIMGHVDHGKTSLLDHIRSSKIVSGEAGGITQSIGAYQVEHNGQKITFLDTPGHEAFTVMRARGAKSTDIAILVVAADEGVKPQTIESIAHAKEAGIPVVVAINKMDKQGANPDHVKGQLAEHGLSPEDWGGDTPMVPVSAMTGFGIEDLLEIIILLAEMQELKANPDRDGVGTIIESHLDIKFGPVATVLVNAGIVKTGDDIVCGSASGKIKVLKNYVSKAIKQAGPGDPILIVGLDSVVEGGDILQVVSSQSLAREKAIEFNDIKNRKKAENASGLEILMMKIKAGNLKHLKIVLKSDTNGSLEAIKSALIKLSTPETTVSVIHSGVGNISEGDILMCQGSEALLIGFNVSILNTAKSLIQDSGVEYISSNIIYHITERVEKIVTGMLDPKEVEIILGKPVCGGIFYTSKKFMVIGLRVIEGDKVEKGAKIRVIRKDKFMGKGVVESLKQGVEEVKAVEGPTECGIKFVGSVEILENDILEIYKTEIQK